MGRFKTEAIRTLRKLKQKEKYQEPVNVPHGMRQSSHNKARHKKALTAIHLATTAPGARIANQEPRAKYIKTIADQGVQVEKYIPQKKG